MCNNYQLRKRAFIAKVTKAALAKSDSRGEERKQLVLCSLISKEGWGSGWGKKVSSNDDKPCNAGGGAVSLLYWNLVSLSKQADLRRSTILLWLNWEERERRALVLEGTSFNQRERERALTSSEFEESLQWQTDFDAVSYSAMDRDDGEAKCSWNDSKFFEVLFTVTISRFLRLLRAAFAGDRYQKKNVYDKSSLRTCSLFRAFYPSHPPIFNGKFVRWREGIDRIKNECRVYCDCHKHLRFSCGMRVDLYTSQIETGSRFAVCETRFLVGWEWFFSGNFHELDMQKEREKRRILIANIGARTVSHRLLSHQTSSHRHFHTRSPSHKDSFTHRQFHIRTSSHRDTFTCTSFTWLFSHISEINLSMEKQSQFLSITDTFSIFYLCENVHVKMTCVKESLCETVGVWNCLCVKMSLCETVRMGRCLCESVRCEGRRCENVRSPNFLIFRPKMRAIKGLKIVGTCLKNLHENSQR